MKTLALRELLMPGRKNSVLSYLSSVAIFLMFSFLRSPEPLMTPRFWAEEGTIYYVNLQNAGIMGSIFLVINANLQIITNIIIKIATLAPERYAPAVTTYISVTVSCIIPLLIIRIAKENEISDIGGVLSVSAFSFLHMSYELFGTATNIQWYCGVIVYLFLFLKIDSKKFLFPLIAFSFLLGLSGVPAVIAAPAFFVIGLLRKSNNHVILGLVFLTCAIIQTVIVVNFGTTNRIYPRDPGVLLLPTILQSVYGFWLPAELTTALGKAASSLALRFSVVAIGAFIVFAIVGALNIKNRGLFGFAILYGFGIAVIQTFAALGNPADNLGGYGGGRYYLISSTALIVALLLSINTRKCFYVYAMTLSVAVQFVYSYSPIWDSFKHGPNWSNELLKCTSTPCHIGVWPDGWKMDLYR